MPESPNFGYCEAVANLTPFILESAIMTYGAFAITVSSILILSCSKNPPPDETAAPSSAAVEPGKRTRHLPPELLAACDGKKAGDECSVQRGQREFKGQCATGPGDAQEQHLLCRRVRPVLDAGSMQVGQAH
jgi:hypothetical protein